MPCHREARTSAGEVFGPFHERRRIRQPRQFRRIGRGRLDRGAFPVQVLSSAKGGGKPAAEIPPPGEYRRDNRARIVHSEREQPVSASTLEGTLEAGATGCIQSGAVAGFCQHQGAMRRQDRD